MARRPPLLTLLASLIVHSGAVAILFFMVSQESHPSVLFVDLETVSEREAAAVASERKSTAAEGGPRRGRAFSARPTERDAGRPEPASSPAPSPAALPSAVIPAPPTDPEPARQREAAPTKPPEPRQPEPAVSAAPAREDAPDRVARSSSSVSPVEVRTNPGAVADRTGSASSGPVGRGATQGPETPDASSGRAGAGVALAPSGPAAGGPGAEYGGYLATVRRLIQETLRYPPPARRRGLKGTVYLEIFIEPDGAIGAVSVTGSSSHPLLDEAALEAVRSLAPQPFPKGLLPRPLRVQLPVVFDLQ